MKRAAFTLVELLVSMAIFLVVVGMLVAIFGDVSRIWIAGNARMTTLQGGRAILDFVSRDVRSIAPPKTFVRRPAGAYFSQNPVNTLGIDPYPLAYLQFVQDAGGTGNSLDAYLPELPDGKGGTGPQRIVPKSSNFFGQMHGEPTVNGDLWIVGYYLADDPDGVRRLYRTLVAPDASDGAYGIFANAKGVTNGNSVSDSWIYDAKLFQPWSEEKRYGASPIAEHVAAFWVTCLDFAGDPIPWLKDASNYQNSAPLKFDSAAHFILLREGAALAAKQAGKPAFIYLDPGVNSSTGQNKTLASHLLPAALQITLIVVDESRHRRGLNLPDPPEISAPGQIPAKATEFLDELYLAGLRHAGLFTTTVEMAERN
jgi:prepilin-type N-terminal cleavage/methylation domain-containing protein